MKQSVCKALRSLHGQHVLRILHVTKGDYELTWDPNDSGSVALAEKEFDTAKEQGLRGFESGADGALAGVQEFNPQADVVVMAPQINGG